MKKCKKKKKRGILESQERPSPLFSHCPGFLLNLQLLFIHLNSFHSGTDCCLFTSTFSSVQLLSRVRLFVTPWITALQASLSITNSRSYSNSCPLSWCCHQAISSSVAPSPPAPNPSQHQVLFQWVNSSHEVAKVLEFQLQHQSFQWTPRTDLL